ncbi:MAG TPA: SDR family oxidoreductase [Acidimicrobiales bacterium]|nr:SDR family oxidoreductase [Acidimicrobiales bacterium]
MGTIAITGSAGGIGAATRRRLEGDGHTVIGVDVRDAEVIADLSTVDGRSAMVHAVTDACGGVLDGLVAGAGIFEADDSGLVVAINYFGAIATLTGLRPLLERGESPSAVAISSNSTTTQPGLTLETAEACLAGDEQGARRAAVANAYTSYPSSKLALAWWVRRHAGQAEWAGAGIRLNAIAPGLILTPMTETMADSVLNLGPVFPVPQRRTGRPEEVAGLLSYLLSPDATFFCGSVVFMDGGTDAAVRSDDWPAPRP